MFYLHNLNSTVREGADCREREKDRVGVERNQLNFGIINQTFKPNQTVCLCCQINSSGTCCDPPSQEAKIIHPHPQRTMKSVAESASPPPPPPPPRRSWSSSSSVTRREIEKFWRKKRLVEEEHFLAAIKAAARLRAARLSQEDYLMFLEDIQEEGATNKGIAGNTNHQEIRVGIKDWWTKSKYAYLNQPAVGSAGRSSGRANRRSNYVPSKFYFCNYKYSPATATATATPPTLSA